MTLTDADIARMDAEDAEDAADRARLTAPGALAGAALFYAQLGLHVFPLQPHSKVPLKGSHGCKDGTADPDQIRAWWQATPDANVAIATGHLVDVIDVDGVEGVRSWVGMVDAGLPPILGTVSTPRAGGGGNHLYIATEGGGNTTNLFPGIDVRAVGGYVVAPPSVNEQGRHWRWRRPLDLTEVG